MKPHLSPTQIEMYTRCPEQYRRRYIEKEILPPGIAMLQGGSFHRAAAVNFRQKIESHADLPANDMREIAASEFEIGLAGGYALSAEESERGAKAVLDESKDATVAMVAFHATQQAADYQPVLVEEKVCIELPNNSHDLLGIIDLADDKDAVIDFKTSSRRKPQTDADASVQLTTYSAAFRAKTGRPPARLSLDVVVQSSKGYFRQLLGTERDGTDFQALANRIDAVTRAVAAGVFPPTAAGNWWCSTRWCGYATTCPYYNSARERKVSDGE